MFTDDAEEHFCECTYQQGIRFMVREEYSEAESYFRKCKDYKDSNQRAADCRTRMEEIEEEERKRKIRGVLVIVVSLIFLVVFLASINASCEEQAQKEAEEKARQERIAAEKARQERIAAEYKKIIDDMVKVEAGSFDMEKKLWSTDGNKIRVTLTKNYWIGKYEVTQKQYEAVMGNNPSEFIGDNRPVENVSWHDAKAFCDKLNELYRDKLPAGYRFDLPTEAQWEFAARGGNKSKGYKCSGSDDIGDVAWYHGNSNLHHDVGQKRPNELGLYDMSGNVDEWCRDWYGKYREDAVTDPTGPGSGSNRVIRGGSWCAGGCRVACRNNRDPDRRFNDRGFRLALVPID